MRGIVEDGAERYADANREKVITRREAAAAQVRAQYAERFSNASPPKRVWLHFKMRRDLYRASRLDGNFYLNE